MTAGATSALATATCAKYPLTDLVNVRAAVYGGWFGVDSPAYNLVMTETGLTAPQMTSFYDASTVNSFGYYLANVLAAESTKWACASATNCTETDTVIQQQWGASTVTMDPLYTFQPDNPYIPVSYSMATWGTTYSTPGVSMPPEAAAYSYPPYNSNTTMNLALTASQVDLMFQCDYSWYGYQNIYNSMLLMQSFMAYEASGNSTTPPSVDNFNQYFVATADQYNIDTDSLYYFMRAMRMQVSYYFLEGLTKQYLVSDLVMGFDTTFNTKVNTGSLLQGNLYVDTTVTPVISWWKGPASGHTFTVFTGAGQANMAGAIYSMDDSNSIFLTNKLYLSNGTFIPVKWYNEANGMIQTFAIPNLQTWSNYGFRLPFQSTQ